MPKWYGGSTLNPDILMPRDEQWKIQWHRVIRWYVRANQIKVKSRTIEPDANDIDVILAFFQNCYHLHDWLQSSRPNSKDKIGALFANNVEMAACRDICNGFKHKALNRPALDPDFNQYREYDHFAAEANLVVYRLAFTDAGGLRKFELFDLVERCFRLWDNFIFDEVDANSAYLR